MQSKVRQSKANNLLTRLWRFLTSWRRTKGIQGSRRPAVMALSARGRKHHHDLEVQDYPIRDREVAIELIDLWNYSYVARHTLSYAARDVFSNPDGSDQGWKVSKYLDQEETVEIDSEVYAVINNLATRRNGANYVLGGSLLKPAIREFLGFGDSFWELGIEREAGTNLYGIQRTMKLPPWEMFRVEDLHGVLLRFEQRRTLLGIKPYAMFVPPKIIHFRYEPRNLYGTSIFKQSLESRADRLEVRKDMGRAARAASVAMKKHHFPEGWDIDQRRQYRSDYEALLAEGAITDMFLHDGLDIDEIPSRSAGMNMLINQDRYLKYEEVPPGFPVWLFPGLYEKGAREIAGKPAEAYLRMRNDWCGILSEGIRWACDVELVLKLGIERYRQLKKQTPELYRIVFPAWSLEEAKKENVKVQKTDVDAFIDELRSYQLKLNGSASN